MSASCGVESSWKSTAGSHTGAHHPHICNPIDRRPPRYPYLAHGSPGLTSDRQSLVGGGGAHDDTGYDLVRYDRATRLRDTHKATTRRKQPHTWPYPSLWTAGLVRAMRPPPRLCHHPTDGQPHAKGGAGWVMELGPPLSSFLVGRRGLCWEASEINSLDRRTPRQIHL